MVRFPTDQDSSKLPDTFRRMNAIVGWSIWRQRIETLQADIDSNPLWRPFLLERHGLELAFGGAHRHLRATGRYPWPPRTAEEYRLYSFMAVAVRVHANLSPRGQARLAGALRSALEKEFGLGPLAHEMTMVAHLLGLGFELEFHDLEYGGGFDFLAARDSARIEVECKHISADIGRQIHRRNLHALGAALVPVTRAAVDAGSGGRFLEITLPDDLPATKEWQRAIADRVAAALSAGALSNDSVCTVTMRSFPLDESPFHAGRAVPGMEEIAQFLNAAFHLESAHVVLNWHPGRGAVVLHFRSRKPDKVLKEIFRRLKEDAKRQFSGDLPAFLCVHLADLTEQQLLELAEEDEAGRATGLQRAVSMLLHKRPHLHSVGIMASGAVRIVRERSGTGITTSVQETGPSYVFRNPDHPMGSDPLLQRVFFDQLSTNGLAA